MAKPNPDYGKGVFRRRIFVRGEPGVVKVELEDGNHGFRVRLAHDGETVTDLTVANPTDPSLGLPYNEARILRALGDPRALRYAPEPLGIESARAVIGSRVGVPSSRVLLTASTGSMKAASVPIISA